MRLIRRLLILTFLGVAGVAAYAQWSDNGAALRAKAAGFARETAKREAGEFASKAADKASGTFSDAALTAKIKSKMALDDHVKARAIDIDTSGGVATLSGVVASSDERKRALQLARDTEGITKVVDELEVRRP
ncbi:MAG TPA: BON domain-containing protein [Vicinamibacterales bacterium]|jgi:osmotically-inducible protein OsmY|nr:BON domain-containing protein [Vicinamibacterales bacterium]